jgi:hypothetical protein
MTNDLETLAPRASHVHAARLADIVLDVAVPAMAALLTLGIFLLAMS